MWPSIIILALISAAVIAVIVNEIKKRKEGRGSCSCGCSGCAMAEKCHKK